MVLSEAAVAIFGVILKLIAAAPAGWFLVAITWRQLRRFASPVIKTALKIDA